MSNNQHGGKVVVVGGGPVGALNTVFLSRRGYKVDLYESRSDIRKLKNPSGRSINLALSFRGLSALKHAGIDKDIISLGTPMHSRYIHAKNGTTYTIPYGRKGQYILSTDRAELNRKLLTLAEKSGEVRLHFQHKLVKCDLKTPSATFQNCDGELVTVTCDAIFGCDGAYSTVRGQMSKGTMDFSQTYIEHGYKELTFTPTLDGEYVIAPNHLHIWPRKEFMLIALPNLDKSFTVTIFMPFKNYKKITSGDDAVEFFKQHFSDAMPLIGEDELRKTFFDVEPLPMVTIRSNPFNYGDTAVLMGDAAHAVVPFYGQGLNAGLEDALIFDELMEEFDCDFSKVMPEFSAKRVKAGHAIADLSLYNYMEMRSHVATPWFLLRKFIDSLLNRLFPCNFIPRYSMVTFTRIPYNDVWKRAKRQDKIVNAFVVMIGCAVAMLGTVTIGSIFLQWKDFSSDSILTLLRRIGL